MSRLDITEQISKTARPIKMNVDVTHLETLEKCKPTFVVIAPLEVFCFTSVLAAYSGCNHPTLLRKNQELCFQTFYG